MLIEAFRIQIIDLQYNDNNQQKEKPKERDVHVRSLGRITKRAEARNEGVGADRKSVPVAGAHNKDYHCDQNKTNG